MSVPQAQSEIVLGQVEGETVLINNYSPTQQSESSTTSATTSKKHYVEVKDFGKVNVTVSFLCNYFNVDRTYYYKYVNRRKLDLPLAERLTPREINRLNHLQIIISQCIRHGFSIGAPRLTAIIAQLVEQVDGITHLYHERTVGRMLAECNLPYCGRISRPVYRHNSSVELDINRDGGFATPIPNQVWCIDFTVFPCKKRNEKNELVDHHYYGFVVLDLFENLIVAARPLEEQTAQAAIEVLDIAYESNPGATPLMHSDCGTQFTSDVFLSYIYSKGSCKTFSKPGHCYQNGAVESLFGKLKDLMITPKAEAIDPSVQPLIPLAKKSDRPTVGKFSEIESFEQFSEIFNAAVVEYNNNIPQATLNGQTPVQRRASFYATEENGIVDLIVPHGPNGEGVKVTVDTNKVPPIKAEDMNNGVLNFEALANAIEEFYSVTTTSVTPEEIKQIGTKLEEQRQRIFESMPEELKEKSNKELTKRVCTSVVIPADCKYKRLEDTINLLTIGMEMEVNVSRGSVREYNNLINLFKITQEQVEEYKLYDINQLGYFFMTEAGRDAIYNARLKRKVTVSYSKEMREKIELIKKNALETEQLRMELGSNATVVQ